MKKNIYAEEVTPPYKPLSKRSIFLKPNKFGQIAKDCIHFQHCKNKRRCWIIGSGDYETNARECLVLNGEFCQEYTKGIGC